MLSKLLSIHFGHISPETFPLPTLGSTLINLSRERHFGRGFLVYRDSVLSQLTPTHPFMALFDFAPYLSSFLSVPTKNIYFTVRATFTPPAQFRQSRILSSVVCSAIFCCKSHTTHVSPEASCRVTSTDVALWRLDSERQPGLIQIPNYTHPRAHPS